MSDPATAQDWSSEYHAPVLAPEIVALLGGVGKRVLDGTLGGGGHSAALVASGASVVAVDRDPEAIQEARVRLAEAEREGRWTPVQANYASLPAHPALEEPFDGVLLDLGISSHQVDAEARGFSFREGAPLDMRMGEDADRTAAELLNEADERELFQLFKEYGDEPRAARLAREIGRRRATRPFETADDFVGAIRAVLGPRSGPGEFARLFQAVRIAVNDELRGLDRALPALRDRLVPGGVLAIITYHSGEDRLVKHAFREWSLDCICPPRQITCTCRGRALGELLTRRPRLPSDEEIAHNPRARSAKLRVWRRATQGAERPARGGLA
jgi:16S rRNA (cytosine1402-N4)-methyltransferase